MKFVPPAALPRLGRLLQSLVPALLALSAWLSLGSAAQACATCSVGDPTLTTFGLGQPFSQRLRVGSRYDMRTTNIDKGTPDGFRRRHHEVALLMAYTPLGWLTLDADLPLVHLNVQRASGAVHQTTQIGDAALGARFQMWSRERIGHSQHLWASTRLVLPTSPSLEGPNGGALPLEEQTGSGAFVPQLGLGYAHTGGVFGGFASARVELPSEGFQQSRPARGLFATLAAQWQPRSWIGLRLGWEQGYEGVAYEPDGREDPDSGGVLWSASLSLLISPVSDLVVQIGGQVPFWQHLRGQHEERPVVLASLLYDLGGD